MPLEIWIAGGFALAALVAIAAVRRLGARRRASSRETKNIYPLW